MGHLTPHEILINILASSVLTLTPSPFSPVKATGQLKDRFGYEIKIPVFGEVIEGILKEKGASPPDLVLVNEKLKMVVAIECKSDFSLGTVEKLSKQIGFYSSDIFADFAKSFVPKLERSEIWVVTYSDQERLADRISQFVEKKKTELKSNCNIVVWEVELKKTDVVILRKVCGEHQDIDLNMYMQAKKGIETALPQLELLIDSSLTYAQRVARIGRRIFSFIVSKSLTEEERVVSLADFKNKFGDAIMADKELANCFRYLTKLIPEIGKYVTERRCIVLKARPDLSKIKNKIEALENVPDEEFKVELSRMEKGTRTRGGKGIKKPVPFKGSLEPWIKKQSSNASSFDSTDRDNGILERAFHEIPIIGLELNSYLK